MTLRWILSLLISVALHLLWIFRPAWARPNPVHPSETTELIVAKSEPVHPPSARPLPPPSEPEVTELSPAQKFRPNTDELKTVENNEENHLETEQADEPGEVQREPPEESRESPPDPILPTEERLLDEPQAESVKEPATREAVKEGIKQYREQLSRRFDDQYTRIPELHTVIQDLSLVPAIDRHFGMVILAYSFVDHRPGPPFILFDNTGHRKLEEFDFAAFSNRIKDRMLYAQYRQRLKAARQHYDINALMTVIGLVPMTSDRYFAAKQLRAIELAGVPLTQVKATRAHYESDGHDGFNLIIDRVVTKDGRRIAVQDEELAYSVREERQKADPLTSDS